MAVPLSWEQGGEGAPLPQAAGVTPEKETTPKAHVGAPRPGIQRAFSVSRARSADGSTRGGTSTGSPVRKYFYSAQLSWQTKIRCLL